MTDFATMRNRILDDLDRTDLTAVAEREIKTAIDYYGRRRFWFLEQRSVSTTIADQEFYGLPADFRDEDSLVIEVSSTSYPLKKRHYNAIEDWFVESSTYTGQPTDYAIYDEQLRLYPVPNGVYQLTLSYIKELAELVAETDSNEWTTEAEALIRSRAEWAINMNKLRRFDAGMVCKSVEENELAEHERLTKARLFTGKVRKRKM